MSNLLDSRSADSDSLGFSGVNTFGVSSFWIGKPKIWIILFSVYPDDSGKELATVLSYLAGRSLSREEIWTAMELPRSTYYDQLDKGTLITADNLRVAAANLGINRAELLTRYRFIQPEEVTALAEEIRGGITVPHASAAVAVKTAQPTKLADWRPRQDAPPL
jgi:hypothetical protein